MHVIRLRGPWEAISGVSGATETVRITLPIAPGADLAALSGGVKFLRRFGRPTGLEAHEQVWLVLDGTRGRVLLNDELLGDCLANAQARFNVTARLEERNVIAIETQLDAPPLAPERLEVSPEIEETLADKQPVARRTFPIGDVRLEITAGE